MLSLIACPWHSKPLTADITPPPFAASLAATNTRELWGTVGNCLLRQWLNTIAPKCPAMAPVFPWALQVLGYLVWFFKVSWTSAIGPSQPEFNFPCINCLATLISSLGPYLCLELGWGHSWFFQLLPIWTDFNVSFCLKKSRPLVLLLYLCAYSLFHCCVYTFLHSHLGDI